MVLVYILLACHLFFCFKTKFVQRHALKGIKYTFSPSKNGGTYAAFASALGTTIGPGNITGVAVAISTGGAGAVFWMWLSGILAMPTKYAEGYLSLKYRQNGVGGPMVLLNRFGYKKLSKIWSYLCIMAGLFMGAAVPSYALADVVSAPRQLTSLCLALLVIVTVSFGVSGISKVCSYLVPVMSGAFILLCLAQIFLNPVLFVSGIKTILRSAFSCGAAVGGGLGAAIKSGITRGLYSNESGLGSGGILAAESGDKNIVMSALGAMTTVLWDTVIMCALSGVVFVMGGGSDAKSIVSAAFYSVPFSNTIVAVCMSMFSFATIIGWYYIAVRALEFTRLSPKIYDSLYTAAVFFGALLPGGVLWGIADGINLLMLVPSLFIFIRLNNKIGLYISNK